MTFRIILLFSVILQFGNSAIADGYHTLSCDDPFLAMFNALGRTDAPLERKYIFDTPYGKENKSLRVTEKTVAFGAAKFSGDAERKLAAAGWMENVTNDRHFIMGKLKEGKFTDKFHLSHYTTNSTPIVDGQQGGTLASSTNDNERIATATNSYGRIYAYGLAAQAVAGIGNGNFFFPYQGTLQSSKLWEAIGIEPVTFGWSKPKDIKALITTNVIARTFPFIESSTPVTNLNRTVRFKGSYEEGTSAGGFYDDLVWYFDESYRKELTRAREPNSQPIVETNLCEFMSQYCNTNALMRLFNHPGGRFDYERSRASSWMSAIKDCDVLQIEPQGWVTNVSVTYTSSADVSIDVDPVVEMVDDEMGWKVLKVTVTPGNLNFSNYSLSIVTNDTSEWDIATGIENTLFDRRHTVAGILRFDVKYHANTSDFVILMPDNGEICSSFFAVINSEQGTLTLSLENYTYVDLSYGGTTNWTCIAGSTETGGGRYSLPSKFINWDDNKPFRGVPDWLEAENYIKSMSAYFFLAAGEQIQYWDPTTWSTQVSNDVEVAIDKVDMLPSGFVGNFNVEWNNALKKMESDELQKTGINLREETVTITPKRRIDTATKMTGQVSLYGGVFIDDFAARRIGNHVYVVNPDGSEYEMTDGIDILIPHSLSFDNEEPIEDDRTFLGRVNCKAKVLYRFKNMRPEWCD